MAGNLLCVKIKDDVRGLACEICLRILCVSEEAGDPSSGAGSQEQCAAIWNLSWASTLPNTSLGGACKRIRAQRPELIPLWASVARDRAQQKINTSSTWNLGRSRRLDLPLYLYFCWTTTITTGIILQGERILNGARDVHITTTSLPSHIIKTWITFKKKKSKASKTIFGILLSTVHLKEFFSQANLSQDISCAPAVTPHIFFSESELVPTVLCGLHTLSEVCVKFSPKQPHLQKEGTSGPGKSQDNLKGFWLNKIKVAHQGFAAVTENSRQAIIWKEIFFLSKKNKYYSKWLE